jgi:hypothetical protein
MNPNIREKGGKGRRDLPNAAKLPVTTLNAVEWTANKKPFQRKNPLEGLLRHALTW